MSVQTPKAWPGRPYTLLGPDRRPYPSRTPGRYGGYRPCAVCLPAQHAAWKAAGKAAGAAPSPAPAVQRARQTAATRCPGRKRRRRPETSSPIRARAISAARGVARASPPSTEGTREKTTANPPPTSTPTSPRTSPAPPSCRTSNGSSSRSTGPDHPYPRPPRAAHHTHRHRVGNGRHLLRRTVVPLACRHGPRDAQPHQPRGARLLFPEERPDELNREILRLWELDR
jgi:hypothetical protein